MRPSKTLAGLWLISASCLAGCNAILGIQAPSDRFDGAVDEPVGLRDAATAEIQDADAGAPGPTIVLWPNWPMPNPAATGVGNAQAYSKEQHGVVTDEVTHLEWQARSDGRARSWREAVEYCADLELDGGGFRLPSRVELLSLIDFTTADPGIDAHAFTKTPAGYFWSASRFVGDPSIGWVVNFGPGPGLVSSSEVAVPYPTRCVRFARGADAGTPVRDFAIEAGTVHDVAAELTWQQDAPDFVYSWKEADAYCAELDLEGAGWRLPTTKELQTLVDETAAMPAIDPIAFPNGTSDYYWTSSRVAGSRTDVWSVSFRFGFDASFLEDAKQHVRCVR